MTSFLSALRQEYARFRSRFGTHLLGVVEIGSFAHGEACSFSDHDLRLIVRCVHPLLVFDDNVWTKGIPDTTVTIDWHDLNRHRKLSFGLTNLAFVERCIRSGCFPLVDHTCLYQGNILLDDTQAVTAFRTRYRDVRFSNIVRDYLRQCEWRVTSKLPSELRTLTAWLDHLKYAVAPIHTCYRIVRDLANIASYDAHGVYVSDSDTVARYYRERWPWFESTFQTLRSYKTDESLRRAVFDDVVRRNPVRLRDIQRCTEATASLWEQFRASCRL